MFEPGLQETYVTYASGDPKQGKPSPRRFHSGLLDKTDFEV